MATKSLIETNTGRTTRLIVYYVNTVLKNPDHSVGIYDHTNQINMDMVAKVETILKILNVDFTTNNNIISVLSIKETK